MKRSLIPLLAAVLLLVPAAGALAGSQPDPRPGDKLLGAKGGIAYVADTETSDNPSYTEADAACPNLSKGWRIAGGGVRLNDVAGKVSASRSQDIYLSFGDTDSAPDDFWQASGRIAAGKKVTSYAICAKEPKLKYSVVATPDGTAPQRTDFEGCPGVTRPTGGGGFIATTNSYITSMYPSAPTMWAVGILDTLGGVGGMTNNVVCLKAQPKRVTKGTTVPSGKGKYAKATCPADTHVTGGGARFGGNPGDARLLSSYPFDGKDTDKVPDDGWKAGGYNVTAGNLELTTFAICLK